MVLFNKKDGIITIEMNEKDGEILAGIIRAARPEQMLAGYGDKEMATDLLECLSPEPEELIDPSQ